MPICASCNPRSERREKEPVQRPGGGTLPGENRPLRHGRKGMALYGQEHIDRYLATDGGEGHDWRGTHALILMTTGRRSGKQRMHPLIYGRHGDDYLVVASKGGAPNHPEWYLNLEANPEVEVQIKGL